MHFVGSSSRHAGTLRQTEPARRPPPEPKHVRNASAERITELRDALRRSLTWDQVKEMSRHQSFTVYTGVQVFFCYPYSPWQRGSNENTRACYAGTSRAEPTSMVSIQATSAKSPIASTHDQEKPSTGSHQGKRMLSPLR